MDTANRAVGVRRSFWQDHLAQWQRSGMTQVAYCHQQGLNLAQFGYWKKWLLAARAPGAATGASPGFITCPDGVGRGDAGRGAEWARCVFTRPTTPHNPFNNPINLYLR